MRHLLLGMVCGVALTAIGWQLNDQAHGQPAGDFGQGLSGGILVVPLASNDTGQNLAIVDSLNRVMGIYAVDQASGRIRLTSIRRFRWDLMLDEYNSMEPTAKEIRALIENH